MNNRFGKICTFSLASFLAFVAAEVFSGPILDQVRGGSKGVLLLQVGSDWCVSGEDVRKVFMGSQFKRAVSKNYILAVYDDMDNPTPKVTEANNDAASVRVSTRRYPAITCITPNSAKFFAQIENIPNSITPEKLQIAIAKVTKAKDSAEEFFKEGFKLKSSNPKAAADAFGKGFDLLTAQAGDAADKLRKGPLAYEKEWNALAELDSGNRYGWVMHFTMGDGVHIVEKATKFREDGNFSGGQAYISSLKAIPSENLSAVQKQCFMMAEYALWRKDGSKDGLCKKLLEDAFNLGRDTIWGQCAMGYLILSGKNIERKKQYRAEVKPRPSGAPNVKRDFPLESIKRSLAAITPKTKDFTEEQKLAIARYAVLRRMEERGWDALGDRKGSREFLANFLKNRSWLEDFAWSGPCDGYNAILALETLYYNDAGRWIKPESSTGRRFATAMALEYASREEAFLVDFFDAYRSTFEAGRLHKRALSQPVWQWRFAMQQGQYAAGSDYAPAQQRFLARHVNMPEREYGGACWMIPYRLHNCFGESVHGPQYYAPWAAAGEWPKRRFSPIVGGVCGELSKFGSACANAHGLPSCTAGQPGHCAYTRRRINGKWEINNCVTYPTHIQLRFWSDNIWSYVTALEGTFEGNRERRLDADRYLELAHLASESGKNPKLVEAFFRLACKSWPSHYNAWREYGDWVGKSGASLETMRVWARGCARGMKGGRHPVWNLITPYFKRVANEKGPEGLSEALIEFAPVLRQSDEKIQEESDFKAQLKEWTAPLGSSHAAILPVLKAMLAAQYGTRDFFSQTLGWGGEMLMGTKEGAALYIKTISDVVSRKTKRGEKPSLDFNPLILEASRSSNLSAFRQLAALQDKLDPFKGSGKSYTLSDFGGTLLSREGLLKTSTTCGYDSPRLYARCIDETPCTGNAFHTDGEDAPWASVMMPGMIEVTGVLLENKCGWQNRHRQVPFEVQVSEDGEKWQTVAKETENRETYRIDLRDKALRAKFVRIQRTPGAKKDVYHFSKILVYGKKLY